ncbi:secretoglobin family 1D member 1-like [Castor canadensis]|uniref:Secretoglobin family 1D member 1-like n=1 Tax=Castor canadensis TaxID=51338 RepID=A0AC58LTU9_CASCN
MRLTVFLLVVTLALCGHRVFSHAPATAIVCPSLLIENTNILMGTPQTAKFQLSFYGAPQEAVDALLKVKECLDNISYLSRLSIDVALGKVVLLC